MKVKRYALPNGQSMPDSTAESSRRTYMYVSAPSKAAAMRPLSARGIAKAAGLQPVYVFDAGLCAAG